MYSKLTIFILMLATIALTTSALAQEPIVHYPLIDDAADATGNYGDITLENCPFVEGGVYCNGDYGDFTCQTPHLTGMDRTLFTFTVEFKIENYPVGLGGDGVMPVMWLSRSWRVMGFEINEEGYAGIRVGNSGDFVPSTVQVSLFQWHTARISWNQDMLIASCYMDGDLIMLAEGEPVGEEPDMRLMPIRYANGHCLTGLLRNLKVYNTDDPEVVAVEGKSLSSVKSLFQ